MPPISTEQKQELCRVASIGCPRGTIARYVGSTPAELEKSLREDAWFARELLRAEAAVELSHMRNVQQAAKDEKHWRASVWWLERTAPQRYARRATDALTAAELRQVLAALTQAVISGVTQAADRGRVVEQLNRIAEVEEGRQLEPPIEGRSLSGEAPA